MVPAPRGGHTLAMTKAHVALITGASRGLGALIARRLSKAGIAVIITARDADACEQLAGELRDSGGWARGVALDVSDPAAIRAGVQAAREVAAEVGPIDWLVNNAGIALTGSALKDGDLYEKQMRINFHGARLMTEALAPAMIEAGYGRLLNVASSAGLQGYSYVAAYCASKHALLGYTRSLAHELRKTGVTLNAVCPHYVDSPMLDKSVALIVERTGREIAKVREFFEGQNPGGCLVKPEEVAEAVYGLMAGAEHGALLELIGGGSRLVESLGS